MAEERHFYKISGHGHVDFRTFVEICKDNALLRWHQHATIRLDARKFMTAADAAVDFHETTPEPVLAINTRMPDIVREHLENRFGVRLEYAGSEFSEN